MVVLLFILLAVFVSIGLLLCSITLRSTSLATLNIALWSVATFAVAPWSTLSRIPPIASDERLGWDAALVWAVFFCLAVITLLYSAIASHISKRPPKRTRRRRRSRNGKPGSQESDDSSLSVRSI